MRSFIISGLAFLFFSAGTLLAQDSAVGNLVTTSSVAGNASPSDTAIPVKPELFTPTLPRMSAELALQAYQTRAARQRTDLSSYSATTVIYAELPQSAQKGEFELKRQFSAPKTLLFTALHFTGDMFVKSNVITRLLQSEVDHVQKDDFARTAISPENYKFSYKGATEVDGQPVHTYQLKPRQKRVGLVKGRMYLNAHTGSLVRIEGTPAKSPSLFLKKIQFFQDYGDFGAFTLPVHVHSEAKASLLGPTVVDIYHHDYQVVSNTVQTAHGVATYPSILSAE